MENKLITIKKLNTGKYYVDFHQYIINMIISFILIFPAIYFSSKKLVFSLICFIIFWIFICIIIDVNDYVGKNVHNKIFSKKIFEDLKFRNFQKEQIDKYEGLIKTENGRTIRIFYNWNKVAEGFMSFGDIEIDIFFTPQIFNNIIDDVKINKLNKKYDKTFWSKTKRTIFAFDRLKIFINYYPWTKSTKIENEISRGLEILRENKLEPFDIRNIKDNELANLEKDGYFLPNMEYIWEYIEKYEKLPPIKYSQK